jgi:hypothetical protein
MALEIKRETIDYHILDNLFRQEDSCGGILASEELCRYKFTKVQLLDMARKSDKCEECVKAALLLGFLNRRVVFFTEYFEDENTHQMVPVERRRYLDEMIFETNPEEFKEISDFFLRSIPTKNDSELIARYHAFRNTEFALPILKELHNRGYKVKLQ